MLLSLIAAATLGSVPVPTNLARWTANDDYPVDAGASGHGRVRIEIVVDDAGNVLRCDVALSSGSRDLDASACTIPLARARFEPARDEAGVPVAGVFGHTFDWSPRLRAQRPAWTDLVVPVSRVPADLASPVVVVRTLVAADGHVDSCRVAVPSGSAVLDVLACAAVAEPKVAAPAADRTGHALRAMRTMTVGFVARLAER